MSSSTYVQLVDLAKYFGKVKALDGLSLDIAQGELVALLGPSGCGKTTALRALAGLQELDRGQLMVDGKDVTFQSASKRGMGMVFQAYSLFPHMTARENVEYGLKLRTHKVSSQKRKERSAELLDLVGLSSHANHYPYQLSGGQQQRIALARAERHEGARAIGVVDQLRAGIRARLRRDEAAGRAARRQAARQRAVKL